MTSEWDDPWYELASRVSSIRTLVRECGPEVFDRQPDRIKNLITYNICKQTRDLVAMLLSTDSRPDGIRLDRLLPDFHSRALDRLRTEYGDDRTEGSPCALIGSMAIAPAPVWEVRPEVANAIAQTLLLVDTVWDKIELLRPKRQEQTSSDDEGRML